MSRARKTSLETPANELRIRAGLTLQQIADHFGKPTSRIAEWIAGRRIPPDDFLLFLSARATLADLNRVEEEQRAYCKRKDRANTTIEFQLPPGVDAEQAREKCLAALGEFVAEGGAR